MHDTIRAARLALARQSKDNSMKVLAEEHGLSDEFQAIPRARTVTNDTLDTQVLVEEAEAELWEKLASKTQPAPEGQESYDFSPILGEKADEALHSEGYDTPEDLRGASDDELLQVDSIGLKTVAKIREEFGNSGGSPG